MSHNQQAVLIFHQFPQGMGFHACLYAGGLFHLLSLAAVILDLIQILHYRLVAAPAQGHINRGSGILIVLSVAFPVHSDSDA